MDEKKKTLAISLGSIGLALTIPIVAYKLIKALCCRSESFKDKVVVITGASSGIGEALAHEFYKQGCKVVLCARRREELERVRTELLQTHPTVPVHPPVVMPVDLSDLNSLEDVVNQILEITGHIDILINNGGISNRGSVADTNNDVFLKVMMVNYFGTVALTKAVLPHMIKQKEGHIVFMNSVQGLIAIPNRSAYSASKHAIKAFSDSLRAEIAEHNVEVITVSPGYVKTAISMNALTGSGDAHGKMDDSTAKGYSTEYVAQKTVAAISKKEKEIVLSPLLYKFVILLRTNAPKLFFYAMAKRAKSEAS